MKCKRIMLALILLAALVVSAELLFRGFLRLTDRDVITLLPPDEVLEKSWFEPHPSLLYVFKPNNCFIMDGFNLPKFTINRFGFRSTLEYDVDTVAKPINTIRVATLGGSTTMGVNDDNKIWPYLLGERLSSSFPDKKIEVLNEGIMGYTSLDNLLDLTMRVIDFNCDIYVIYLGVNDLLTAAPLKIYRSDYSHFKMTIYESLYASPAGRVPGWLLKSKVVRSILQIMGAPDSRLLFYNTGTPQFRKWFVVSSEDRPEIDNKIRSTVIRNVKSMIGVIRVHRPDAIIVISSFYDLRNQPAITALNRDLKRLSNEHDVVFVDTANDMERDRAMAYDYGHFTLQGDSRMADLYAGAIIREIRKIGVEPENSSYRRHSYDRK